VRSDQGVRLRYILRPREVVNQQHLIVLSVYRDHGVVPKDSRTDNFNKTPSDISRYQEVRPGDLVVNKMKAWQGSLAVSQHHGIVSPDYLVCSVSSSVEPRYLHYLLRSSSLIWEYQRRSRGIRPAQWRLYWDDLAEVTVELPRLEEQRRIADFLDAETSRISRLIDRRLAMVRLLNARLSQVIDGAVVGDQDALRELGIRSDRDWQTTKISRICQILSGYGFPSDGFVPMEEGVPLLRGVNVGVNAIDWSEAVSWPRTDVTRYSRFSLRDGDLVLGMDRPWISSGLRIAEMGSTDLPALLLQRVACLRVRSEVHLPFVRWALTSSHFKASVEAELTGVSVPHISAEQIGRFRFLLPEYEGQVAIASGLSSQLLITQEARLGIDHQLALLAERRQSLITAAVTGQLDPTTSQGVG
jgi:type I restriction enzyme S subunit